LIYSTSKYPADDLFERMPVDVIIDFSSEQGLDYYGEAAAARRTVIVTAVSHYSEAKQRQLRRLSKRTPVLWSPNITLGINFMLLAAQTLQRIVPEIDVQVIEEHFREKIGVSGTATRIATALGLPGENVHAIRAGGIIGVHELLFGFPAQTIRLRHEAISREAFGSGAIFAAKGLVTLPNGMYQMEELLWPYFAMERTVAATEELGPSRWRERVATSLRSLACRVEGRQVNPVRAALPATINPLVEMERSLLNVKGAKGQDEIVLAARR
jgi:4-hydroxy-tetrahydrodipicolinate reductase